MDAVPTNFQANANFQMCNAVLCVIGRQWVGKLLSRPVGRTHCERTMRPEERKRPALVWLKPLVVVLYWSLLSSIGLFIAGLLYQLQLLSTSFDETARVLEATWALGLFFVAGIIAIIAATTIHAIRFDLLPVRRVTEQGHFQITATHNGQVELEDRNPTGLEVRWFRASDHLHAIGH